MAQAAARHGAGATGGLVAGTVLSLLFLVLERASGKPSDIVRLGRRTANTLGSPDLHQDSLPTFDEQVRYHGGHLVLSATMGATYPAMRRLPGLRGAAGGLVFGVAFYGLLWGLVGPRLGLTPTPRQEGAAQVAQRIGIHALLGLVTAPVAGPLCRAADRTEIVT